MNGEKKYVLWLCSLAGLGNTTMYRLWKESGENPDFARKLYEKAGREDMRLSQGPMTKLQGGLSDLTGTETEGTLSGRDEQRVTDILHRGRKACFPNQLERSLQEKKIHFVWAGDADFPGRLRNIPDPPFALYYRGRLPEEGKRSVGIVGARMASPYGRDQARRFSEKLAAGGIQIISGMARGVDGIAGRGALDVSDASFAVLGCGVDICYPRENRELYEALCSRGGVISEYRPGTEPEARLFPPRNRIISALSDALLVVEARERSGTLITVDCALEQGKDVFAVPGRVCDARSMGCNELIRQGAGIAVSPESLLEELEGGRQTNEKQKSISHEHGATHQRGEPGSTVPGNLQKPEAEQAVRNAQSREEALSVLPDLERSILRSLDTSTAKSVDEIMPGVNRRMHKSCTFPVVLRAVMKLSAAGYVREVRVGKYISV